MSMIGFPLLLIPLAIYNIFVFLMPGVAFTSQIVTVTLMSGVQWTLTFGDALIALAIVLLLFEVIKASRPGTRYLTDHLLSLIVFGGATAEFLFLKALGTSDFFLLTVLTGVEFVGGAVMGLRNRRYTTAEHAPLPVRHEPVVAETVPAPVATAPEPPTSDIIPPQTKPPEMISVSPATAAPASLERKVSNWKVSDLIADRDSNAGTDSPAAKAGESGAPKP